MCSGSEAGSYVRLIDFVYHSTLGLRVIKKRREDPIRCRKQGPVSGWELEPLTKSEGRQWSAERESSLLTTYWSESILSS